MVASGSQGYHAMYLEMVIGVFRVLYRIFGNFTIFSFINGVYRVTMFMLYGVATMFHARVHGHNCTINVPIIVIDLCIRIGNVLRDIFYGVGFGVFCMIFLHILSTHGRSDQRYHGRCTGGRTRRFFRVGRQWYV